MKRNHALLIVLMLGMIVPSIPALSQSNAVLKVTIDDEITDVTVLIIEDAIETATRDGVQAIILELNTPGGEGDATFEIMDLVANSPIPVIGYVAPIGANAFSAGTYILMATHIATMAPGASIGSAQPVTSTGDPITETKYINALINKMLGAARVHNRNETAAREFITENLNFNTHEALAAGVIEIAPTDYSDLLVQLENRILVRYDDNWRVYTDNEYSEVTDPDAVQLWDFELVSHASTTNFKAGLLLRIMDILSDPNLAYLLLLIGVWALILGLQSPGFGAEIIGAVSLVLGLIGVGVIGLSLASFLLFILGALLLVIDLKFHSGVLAMGGTICLLLGSLFIVPSNWIVTPDALNNIRYGLFAIAGTIGGIFAFAMYKAGQIRRRPPLSLFRDTIAIATSDIAPKGTVRFKGAIWRAEVENGENITSGQKVNIIRNDGLKLIVEPVKILDEE